MTGLSKSSHVSNTRKILRILSIHELNDYIKLIFIKNLKNSRICSKIFSYLINNNYSSNTKSIIKEIDSLCSRLDINKFSLLDDIQSIIKSYKKNCLYVDINIENELIKSCLNYNQDRDRNMINQLNLITYSGLQYNSNFL